MTPSAGSAGALPPCQSRLGKYSAYTQPADKSKPGTKADAGRKRQLQHRAHLAHLQMLQQRARQQQEHEVRQKQRAERNRKLLAQRVLGGSRAARSHSLPCRQSPTGQFAENAAPDKDPGTTAGLENRPGQSTSATAQSSTRRSCAVTRTPQKSRAIGRQCTKAQVAARSIHARKQPRRCAGFCARSRRQERGSAAPAVQL